MIGSMRVSTISLILVSVGITLFSGCDCSCEDAKPNLVVPYLIEIPNPYNGQVSYYRNEWYYSSRFAQPWPCYFDCNYVPNGYTCNGWNNQQGFFYWGQCIPPLVEGDVIVVRSYIKNNANPPNCPWWCNGSGIGEAGASTTRIIVRDPNNEEVTSQDKPTKKLAPGEWDIFTYTMTLGQNGATSYEIVTDFYNEVDEADETDNVGDVPGLDFD